MLAKIYPEPAFENLFRLNRTVEISCLSDSAAPALYLRAMDQDGGNRTEIGELGEFGLIDRIASQFQQEHAAVVRGIGDDAAVLQTGGDQYLLWSTDTLAEGIHFDLAYMPLRHLGFKAVASNVSDICAMNGKATAITVGLGLSNRFSVEAVDELYSGIRLACERYGIALVGGDTTASPKGLVIHIGIVGQVAPERIAYRSGAKPGDILCVSGDLGAAYLGLQILEREKRIFLQHPDMQPDLSKFPYLIERQLKPEARVKTVEALEKAGVVPSSMIDISDGLSSEVFHLHRHSGVDFSIFEEKLPLDQSTYDQALAFNLDPGTCALNGGEDYELLFTVRQEDWEKVVDLEGITAIGYATEAGMGMHYISKAGNVHPLMALGWQHGRSQD